MPALVFCVLNPLFGNKVWGLCGNRAAAKLSQDFRMLFAPISDKGNRMVSGNL